MEIIPKIMNITISTTTITNLVEGLKMARAEGALKEVEDFPQDLSSCCNIRLEHTNRCDAKGDYFLLHNLFLGLDSLLGGSGRVT